LFTGKKHKKFELKAFRKYGRKPGAKDRNCGSDFQEKSWYYYNDDTPTSPKGGAFPQNHGANLRKKL